MTAAYSYMTFGEAVTVLGLSRQRVAQLINDGRITRFYVPGRRRGMVPRLMSEDVYAYAEARKHRPAPKPKPERKRTPPPLPWWHEPHQPQPMSEEDKIISTLVAIGLVDMDEVYRVANQRRMAQFDASGLTVVQFINNGC